MQYLENSLVQKTSFVFLIYGLFLWLLEKIVFFIGESINSDEEGWLLLIVWGVISIISFSWALDLSLGMTLPEIVRGLFQ